MLPAMLWNMLGPSVAPVATETQATQPQPGLSQSSIGLQLHHPVFTLWKILDVT